MNRLIGRSFFVCAWLAIVAACLFRVWVHQSIVSSGYSISEARSEARELAKQEKALSVELAAARSPERLKTEAKRHGLAPMSPNQLHVVRVEVSR